MAASLRSPASLAARLAALAALGALFVAPAAMAGLADHVVTEVLTLPQPLAPAAGNWSTWNYVQFSPRLYLAPATDTQAWVGWTDAGGNGHVSRVEGGVVVATHDFAGMPVAGLVSHGADLYAALVRDGSAGVCRLVRRQADGAVVWSTPLTNSVAVPGTMVGDYRLAYGGGVYAARFAIHGTVDPFTGHEGDQGTFVDDGGTILPGGWNWGPAHGMAQLAAYHDATGQMLTLAVSDCYPAKGIVAGTTQMLHLTDADCMGGVAVDFGQLAARPHGWLLIFNGITTMSYAGHGIGLMSINLDLSRSVTWLTYTDGTNERDPVMARLGLSTDSSRYLVGWRNSAAALHYLAVIDSAGLILQGPEEVTSAGVGWGNRDDSFRTDALGRVRWLEGAGGATTLELHTFTDPLTAVPPPIARPITLHQNAPNPFNPLTAIRFDLAVAGRTRLAVYDVRGGRVRVLVDAMLPAGSHEAVWDGRDETGRAMASGMYVARLRSGAHSGAVTLTLAR